MSLTIGAAVAGALGCGPPANPQKLRDEVLQADPSFAAVLEKRDEQANRISLLEREFDLKRTQTEGRIAQLRKEVQTARAQADQKVQQSKALLTPDLDRLQLAVSMASEERQAKRAQRASLGRSISRLKKALQSGDAVDRASRERELAEFLRETQRLDREIEALNTHLRLLKTKLLLLRL